jgi:chromosomal replication initiation ATPase DnaA
MSFFEDVKILDVTEKTARISVPKAFYITYLSQKFFQSILRSLKAFDGSLEHFDLVFMDHKSPKGLDVLEEKNEQ